MNLRHRVVSAAGLLSLFSLLTPVAHAKIHTGLVEFSLSGDGWDFSDSLHTSPASGADIAFTVTAVQNDEWRQLAAGSLTDLLIAIAPAAITFVGPVDSTYEKLDVAPVNPDVYGSSEFAFVGDVFVVKTREGHYAKLKVITFNGFFRFVYTYQDDGSPSFVPEVPVRPVTWGRVKSLYKSY